MDKRWAEMFARLEAIEKTQKEMLKELQKETHAAVKKEPASPKKTTGTASK